MESIATLRMIYAMSCAKVSECAALVKLYREQSKYADTNPAERAFNAAWCEKRRITSLMLEASNGKEPLPETGHDFMKS